MPKDTEVKCLTPTSRQTKVKKHGRNNISKKQKTHKLFQSLDNLFILGVGDNFTHMIIISLTSVLQISGIKTFC